MIYYILYIIILILKYYKIQIIKMNIVIYLFNSHKLMELYHKVQISIYK